MEDGPSRVVGSRKGAAGPWYDGEGASGRLGRMSIRRRRRVIAGLGSSLGWQGVRWSDIILLLFSLNECDHHTAALCVNTTNEVSWRQKVWGWEVGRVK